MIDNSRKDREAIDSSLVGCTYIYKVALGKLQYVQVGLHPHLDEGYQDTLENSESE